MTTLGLQEERFTRKLALLKACADKDVELILSFTNDIVTIYQSEYALTLRALKHVETKLTPAHIQRIIALRDRLIEQTPLGMGKKRIEKDFEKFSVNAPF